ncbi:hypothetical protein SRABI133_03141 [Peribacillus simplex]|uniref:Methyl-accepting chemotaxis protein n=1 Tax=Peribacillus simplex TaxID=1478 RepID=A0A9W4PHV5_9BACI|nr:hypothetical protein SRABI133_03141 [Peribacillus simplex]
MSNKVRNIAEQNKKSIAEIDAIVQTSNQGLVSFIQEIGNATEKVSRHARITRQMNCRMENRPMHTGLFSLGYAHVLTTTLPSVQFYR